MRLPVVVAAFVLATASLPVAVFAAENPPAVPAAPTTMPAGHPAMGSMMAAPAASPKATHAGSVTEILPAGPYIYIHAKGAEGEEWLAASALDLKPGASIKWNDGSIMNNYQSKSLNRTFDKVRFVEVVEVVKP